MEVLQLRSNGHKTIRFFNLRAIRLTDLLIPETLDVSLSYFAFYPLTGRSAMCFNETAHAHDLKGIPQQVNQATPYGLPRLPQQSVGYGLALG